MSAKLLVKLLTIKVKLATINFQLSTQVLSIRIRKCKGELGLKRNIVGIPTMWVKNMSPLALWMVRVWAEKVCKGWHLSSFLQYSLSLIGHKAKNNNKIYLTLYFIVMIEQVITFFGMLRHNNGTLARHGSQDGSHGWTDQAFNVQTWTQPSAASPPDQN